MLIVPAILEKSIDDFWAQIKHLSPHFSHFQIDIADGEFVPNKTIQIESIYTTVKGQMSHVKGQKYDFHLMVRDWKKEIEQIEKLKNTINIENILIHAGIMGSRPADSAGGMTGGFGLVLNPEDSVSDNWQTIEKFPIVQLMTVNPGFQGSPFLPEQLDKIDELKSRGFKGQIFLDGGINKKTIPQIVSRKNLPNVLGVGSFITHSKDIKKAISELQRLIPSAHL